MLVVRYSKLVAKHPVAILVSTFLGVIALIVIYFGMVKFPDMRDPDTSTKGYVARGNDISKRINTIRLMYQNLHDNHLSYFYCPADAGKSCDSGKMTRFSSAYQMTQWVNMSRNPIGKFMNGLSGCQKQIDLHDLQRTVIFKSNTDEDNMLNAEMIRSACLAEQEITNYNLLQICPSYSMRYIMDHLFGRTTCGQITEADVQNLTAIAQQCAPYYQDKTLEECYVGNKTACALVPEEICTKDHAMFILMYFVAEKDFATTFRSEGLAMHLRFGNEVSNIEMIDFFKHQGLRSFTSADGKVEVIATATGAEFELFLDANVRTFPLFGVAGVLIVTIILLKTMDPWLTIATIVTLFCSFFLTAFIFYVPMGIQYFPSIAYTISLLIIAIGADDVFIYHDIWRQMQIEHGDQPTHIIIAETFRHAASSLFVTSFTTAAAFLTTGFTTIIDMRIFGLYAGLLILINFVLVILWIPPALVLSDQFWDGMKQKYCEKQPMFCIRFQDVQSQISKKLTSISFYLVDKFHFGFLIILTLMGAFGIVSVTVYPQLKLPEANIMDLFTPKHPYELYRSVYADKFDFAAQGNSYIPLSFFAGVKKADNGEYFNPDNWGTLEFKDDFDFTAQETQLFLRSFCEEVIDSEFIAKTRPYKYSKQHSCLFNVLPLFLQRPCNEINSPCCNMTFPYEPEALRQCLPNTLLHIRNNRLPVIDNPLYDTMGRIRAVQISIMSKFVFSIGNEIMDGYWKKLTAFEEQHSKDVDESRKTWVVGQFHFYDLQVALTEGVITAMILSLAMSLVVLLLISLNLLLTIYAIVTIAFTIFLTTGILVWSGWQLNVMESMAIIMAVGLSIDFSIHYSVAYRLAVTEAPDRRERVRQSFKRVGSAILMAACTTFLGGLSVVPGTDAMAYYKLGCFLMLCMTSSWIYATFFFQSLCFWIGPQGNFGQIANWSGCNKGVSQIETDAECPKKELSGQASVPSSPQSPKAIVVVESNGKCREPKDDSSASASPAVSVKHSDTESNNITVVVS